MSIATWPTCPVHGPMEECTIDAMQPAFRCPVSTAPSIFEHPTQEKMARVPASQIFRLLAEIGQKATWILGGSHRRSPPPSLLDQRDHCEKCAKGNI